MGLIEKLGTKDYRALAQKADLSFVNGLYDGTFSRESRVVVAKRESPKDQSYVMPFPAIWASQGITEEDMRLELSLDATGLELRVFLPENDIKMQGAHYDVPTAERAKVKRIISDIELLVEYALSNNPPSAIISISSRDGRIVLGRSQYTDPQTNKTASEKAPSTPRRPHPANPTGQYETNGRYRIADIRKLTGLDPKFLYTAASQGYLTQNQTGHITGKTLENYLATTADPNGYRADVLRALLNRAANKQTKDSLATAIAKRADKTALENAALEAKVHSAGKSEKASRSTKGSPAYQPTPTPSPTPPQGDGSKKARGPRKKKDPQPVKSDKPASAMDAPAIGANDEASDGASAGIGESDKPTGLTDLLSAKAALAYLKKRGIPQEVAIDLIGDTSSVEVGKNQMYQKGALDSVAKDYSTDSD